MNGNKKGRPAPITGRPSRNTHSLHSQDRPDAHSLTTRQGFREWLIARKDEPSLGDLGYDAEENPDFPDADDLAVYVDYLSKCGAVPEAFDELYEAWSRFRPDAYNPARADRDARDLMALLRFEHYGDNEHGCPMFSDPSEQNTVILHVHGCPRFDTTARPAPLELNGPIADLFGSRSVVEKDGKRKIKHSGRWVSRQRFARMLLGVS